MGQVRSQAWVGDEEPSGADGAKEVSTNGEDSSVVMTGKDGEGENDEEESEYEIEQHDGSKKGDAKKAVKKTVKGNKSLAKVFGHVSKDGEGGDQDSESAHGGHPNEQGGEEDADYDPDRARNYVA